MITKGKKVGMFVGFVTVLIAGIMLISNIFFGKNFSYAAINLCNLLGTMILVFISTEKKEGI